MKVDYFEAELLPTLKQLLRQPSGSIEYALFQALEEAKAPITTFLDLAPRDGRERQDIESGSLPSARGVTLFNESFKRGVLSLAEELNASEHYCARLLEHVLPDATQSVNEATVQSAVLSRHNERSAMLASLRLIFEAATNVDAPPSRVRDFLQKFMFDVVQGPYSDAGNQPSVNLASKLVFEIDATSREITRLDDRAISAGGPTIEWINTLVRRLQEQRQQCGHLLYLVSAAGQLRPADVLALIKWMSKLTNGNDNLGVYILISLFETTSPPDDEEDEDTEVSPIFSDPQLFVAVNSALNARWQNTDLHSAMLLQYSLFHLEVRSRDTHVRGEVSVIEDEVGASLKKAISAGAFQGLGRIILRSRDPRYSAERPEFSLGADNSILSGRGAHPDAVDERALVSPEFRTYLLKSVDNLLTALITRLSRTLRDVRKQEEDIIHGSKVPRNYSVPHPASRADLPAEDVQLHNNIESLFRLIAIIYDEQPADSALRFWTDDNGGRLFSFLRWAAESRQPGAVVGMLDMMMSLSRGQSCAVYAYNFLSTGGGHYAGIDETPYTVAGTCSWSTLFMALHHYETRLPASQGAAPAAALVGGNMGGMFPGSGAASVQPRPALQPDEVAMIGSFLRVLRNVVRFSPVARLALHDNRDFRAVQTMFTLASHSIPLELKAMLFDALSAFAAPGGGSVAVDLVHQMWGILEKMEIIPVRGNTSPPVLSGRVGRPAGGAVVELEVVEAGGRTYPGTLAFIQLLNALIHTPPKALTLRGGVEAEFNTIPTNLGAGYRLPGLKPYVDFVIEKIFVKIFDREYVFTGEKWQLMEACLCFIEKSLASFDLSPLFGREFTTWPALSPGDRARVDGILCTLVTHPGFFVMKSILGQPSVRRNILHVVDTGFAPAFAGLNSSYSRSKSALRAFRVMHRVLQVQAAFGEVLIPILNDAGELPGVGNAGFALSSLLPLDACILQAPQIVPHIALYATLDDPRIPFFAVQILRALSDHPNFSWADGLDPLVAAMESSPYLYRIVTGFVGWLECDVDEDLELESDSPDNVLSGDAITSAPKATDVRQAILNMLNHNTRASSPPHNIAHLFLGLHRGSSPESAIHGPSTSVRTCLHAILDLVNRGLAPEQHRVRRTLPLSQTHPLLAEKCYMLIHQLCIHPWTSGPVIRYLRSREHFFSQQLTALPIKIPPARHTHSGRISFLDGVSFETPSRVVISCLRTQSSILQCLALEIRLLHETQQHLRVDALLDGLFGTAAPTEPEDRAGPGYPSVPGQLPTRMLHMLDRLLLQWTDTEQFTPINLQLFQGVDWESSLQTDENGCLIYDSRQLVTMLKDARTALQRAGSLSASGAGQQLREETDFVLRSAVRENVIRQISFAKDSTLAAWAALLEVILTNGFNAIRAERREAILHDLLLALPQYISASVPATAFTLSSTFLLLVSKLRESTARQSLLSTFRVASLPAERFHVHLKNAFECLLQQGTGERTRGNLYAALIRYLHMMQDLDDVGSTFREAESFRDSAERPGAAASPRPVTSSYLDTVKIVNLVAEKFVPIVCRDAIDGSEVWKAVSFTLLSVLIRLTRHERSQKVLSIMVKGGFLQTIVGSIAGTNDELLRVLQPNTGSLNALYVYEAKMTLLMRLSEYRGGAERLIESHVFSNLSALEVLDAGSALVSESHGAPGSFVPTATERYTQLLVPALEIAVGCLSAIGASVSSVTRQGFEFLLAHRDAFLTVLSEPPQRWSPALVCSLELIVATATLVFDHAKNNIESFKPIYLAAVSLAQHCYSSDLRSLIPTPEPTYPIVSKNALPTLRNAFRSLLKWISTFMATAAEFPVGLGKVCSVDLMGNVASYSGRNPAFEDILGVLASDIQLLHSQIQQCHELDTRTRDIERITPEDADEIFQQAQIVVNLSEVWTFAQKRTVSAKILSQALEAHIQNILDTLYRTEVLLTLVVALLEDFLQGRRTPILQISATRELSLSGHIREAVISNLIEPLSSLEHLEFDILMNFDAASSQRAFLSLLIRKITAIVTSDGDWEVIM